MRTRPPTIWGSLYAALAWASLFAAQGSVRAESDTDRPVDFANEVVPVLTRYGCNAGGCHGKASGQNGFKLSLFGFDPGTDYAALVEEARGRRVMPGSPGHSLLLTKPTGQARHGGGRRFGLDSEAYRLLYRWIAQGMPPANPKNPTLKRLEVIPGPRVMDRRSSQQLAVLAHYSDGYVRDVTRQAQFQSNEPAVAAVDEDGLVRTLDLAGEAAVMTRYQGLVAVFRATVPLGGAARTYDFPAVNSIDRLALAKWKKLGLVPSDLCTDSEFIRRVYLDLCGKLPSAGEVRTFLADRRPDKRARLIDCRLDDPDYAAYSALRWGSILRNSPKVDASEPATYEFHQWMRDMFRRNRSYDEFVRGILTAAGDWQENPAVNWYWQMSGDPVHQPTADVAQLFLGLRIQCAHCHHHPFERWSQDDYYGLAGFFTRLGRKSYVGDGTESAVYVDHNVTSGEVNPRTGQSPEPKVLDGPVIAVKPGDDPRRQLADWMVKPDNPYFAKAFCNRTWGHLFGRGLVDPIDDIRETNPPSNPELLDALAKDFTEHHYDVKFLIRTICNSRTYQLSSAPNDYNRHDRQNFARYYAKRLFAEVFLDAVDQACGTRTEFNKVPKKARAVDLPHEGFDSYFLDVFERPARNSACECSRGNGASLAQVLHLANSGTVEDKLADDNGRVAKLLQSKTSPDKMLEDIYLSALAREPTAQEKARALEYLKGQADPRRGWEDIVWALLNGREFQFNH